MQSCSVHHCVLFLLTLTLTTAPLLAVPAVRVKVNDTAALPCKRRCSGSVKWTVFQNRDIALAQCDQKSCRSVEGYGMSYDQYLKGNFSLSITTADYSKRGLYTCDCDSRDICDVHLSIETMVSLLHKKPGEALVMHLAISEHVEVIYNPIETTGRYSGQICTVDGDTLQCKAEYTRRASLRHSTLTLVDANLSDSGVYIIRDMKNNEAIHMYTITVEEDNKCPQRQEYMIVWMKTVAVLVVLVLLLLGSVLYQWRGNKQHQKEHKEKAEKGVTWLWSSQGAEQELIHGRSGSDRLHSTEKPCKRSFSDTSLEQLRRKFEQENLKHRHAGGTGRGHHANTSTEGTQESTHMPLLSEEE